MDSPDQALEWQQMFERDERGRIDPNGLMNARRHADAMRAASGMAGAPSVAGLAAGAWTWLGPGNVGGRTRGLVIHPTVPSTLFAGSVAGGLWRTTDSGANWTVVDDFMANLAISSIVYRPGDPTRMFVGTGESFTSMGILGAGIFTSTNGGTTWTQLPSTAAPDFTMVNRLAYSPDGATLIAVTQTGIYRSLNLGVSWTLTLNAPEVKDVKFIAGSNTRAVASGQNRDAWFSTDAGVTWTPATGWTSGGNGRVELGVSVSQPEVVYASMERYVSGVAAGQVWKSTNFGESYVLMATQDMLGYQGRYDNVVWVDPTNANTVLVGGIGLWRSTNGGATFTMISGGAFHPDQHVIVNEPGFNGTSNRRVYVGNDGGMYRIDDVYAAPTPINGIPYTVLNNNYGVTQFYAGAAWPDGRILGGAQDNGTTRYTPADGPQAWLGMNGGDGGFPAVDPIAPTSWYTSSQLLNVYRTDLPELFVPMDITGCNKLAPYRLEDKCAVTVNFIAPMIVDAGGRMFAGGRSLWRSNNPRATITATTGPVWANVKAPIGSTQADQISAITVAAVNPDIIWVGHNNGAVYKTLTGTSTTPIWIRVDTGLPPLPDRAVASIAIDPADATHVFVSFGGYTPDNLWRTFDGGVTWSDATGSGATGLPDAPTRGVTVHPTVPNFVYAATDVGVFASQDGGTTWQVPHDGPANVAVFQLFWINTTLVAVTHGRGMFSAPVNPSPPIITTQPASMSVALGQTAGLAVVASGATPLTYQWYLGTSPDTSNPIPGATSASFTTPPLSSNASYWVRVSNAFGFANSVTATITVVAFATFDGTLQAPRCSSVGNTCDSGGLLNGRDNVNGGAEPNQPNTIMDFCSDGVLGMYHVDESIDRIKVFTLDGTPFAPGKTVQVDASVWAYASDFGSDRLDLYSAPNAANPVWTPIATNVVPVFGEGQTISRTFVLPAGSLQAVRARFRYQGVAGTCTVGGDQHWDDHDDLIFAVGVAPGPELIQNGDFSGGMTNWSTFDSPMGVGAFNVVGGVMQFSRSVPPPGTINQATIFQATGQALPANTPLTATFQIGNTGPNRRYMKVLMVGDPGFADLAACTFWLEAGQPLTTYSMKGHTTQAAPNIALYFYASSHSGSGGSYLLDNVSMQVTPGDSIERIACFDPNAPTPPGGAVGPDLVTNGNFGTGSLTPWVPAGPVTWQINPTGNVLEFIRTASPNPPAVPPAVILQATGQAMTNDQIMTATFMIGNSSPVRKRVLLLVHDLAFGDLVACTWWLNPGQALSRYVMKLYASAAWANATVAIYPSTTGADQWIRIDDITLQLTPGLATVGSECLEGTLAVGPEPNGPGGTTGPQVALPTRSRGGGQAPEALPADSRRPKQGRTRGRTRR